MTICLRDGTLTFDFSDYHPRATFSLDFQRTLRIPDDGRDYPLPPGLGTFPLEHVDDYAERLPAGWHERGGVFFPMYQAEAMWISFRRGLGARWGVDDDAYPFAVKIATGKINCVTGEPWSLELKRSPTDARREAGFEVRRSKQDQNYVVLPQQPWLDGYAIEKGVIRQFVAMPLGKGYTAEEQLTGAATWGGIQIVAYPLKKSKFEELEAERERRRRELEAERERRRRLESEPMPAVASIAEEGVVCHSMPMRARSIGLAPGGRMRQHIYEDQFSLDDWDLAQGQRCFVAILNTEDWHAVTGTPAPTKPITAAEYAMGGLPWFDYYADRPAVQGSEKLAGLNSVATFARDRDRVSVPELSESVPVTRVIKVGALRASEKVRQADF